MLPIISYQCKTSLSLPHWWWSNTNIHGSRAVYQRWWSAVLFNPYIQPGILLLSISFLVSYIDDQRCIL